MRSFRWLNAWISLAAVTTLALGGGVSDAALQDARGSAATRPEIALHVAPLDEVAPVAQDGHHGLAFLRKPPGNGPFPAVVLIHWGVVTLARERLRESALGVLPSRFLAAGYVVATITYRSRDVDPQSRVSLDDSLAAVAYLQRLPYVDAASVGVFGCSGGGDLALAVAAETRVAAIVAEEPASILFTGVFHKASPKAGERYTPRDSAPIFTDIARYYTEEHQRLTRSKIARMQSPILIVQGDVATPLAVNDFNAAVLIPELRAAGKTLEVITYPDQPHCFAQMAYGSAAAGLKAFEDSRAFFARYMKTQARPLPAALAPTVPLPENRP